MTLTELRYIVAVARHRHFGKAAEACFVSQPTLSVGVRKLEEELGVRIFERSRSEVIVTPIGATLVARAEEVLDAAEALRETAAAAQDPLGSALRLGVIYTVGPFLVPRLISALKKRAPQLGLIVREGFTDELAESLRHGELDAVIMSLPFRDPRLISRPLYEEPFHVAVPKDHPLARRKRIKPADLADETLLLLGARNCFREQVVEICPACINLDRKGDEDMQRTLEGSSLDTIMQMVATGAGVTVVPTTMPLNKELGRHVVLRPFARPVPSRTIAVFYRRGFARPALINCIAEVVRAARLDGVSYNT
ncbi:MAG: LysR family transcriptional regulator [Gammaproteobacteria bacterium]|nr:LysR family transcriptional regulator [Gammaproteobacteria bacterium]MCP5201452.1 LysR family transcriptional regulator [Gammaproteobacteria bacterium]